MASVIAGPAVVTSSYGGARGPRQQGTAQMHTVLVFWGWPNGSLWSNLLSNPIAWAAAILGAIVFRKWLGRKLSAWWHRANGHHLAEMERRLSEQMRTHHEDMKAHVTALHRSRRDPAASGDRMHR